MGNTFDTAPAESSDTAEGYYAKRAKVVRTAGQDNYDLGFNLDNDATTADEAIAQNTFDDADDWVDSIAMVCQVVKETADHYIDTASEIYGAVTTWASRWARAQGYLLRGQTGGTNENAEGQMLGMKKEARDELVALFNAYRLKVEADAAAAADAGTPGMTVIHAPCYPCRPYLGWGCR